jgi:hypothetical protein
MSTEEILRENESYIFSAIQNLNFEYGDVATLTSEEWKSFCTNQNEEISFYEQNWKNYFLKDYSGENGVNEKLLNDKKLIEIFSHEKVLNIFYFEVWGNVLEHKDPRAFVYGYPKEKYNTLLMPISVPSQDDTVFRTFYDKKYVELKEGKFMKWDVSGVPHYWEFDYAKVNKLFKLLHIDFYE